MKTNNQAIVVTSIICGVILVIALAILFMFNSAVNIQNDLSVQGTASIKAVPDLVTVYFIIETKEDTSIEAKDANTKIYNEFLSQLIILGFEESEIQTENFNVYPVYNWKNGMQIEDGFRATHNIKIELPIAKAGEVDELIDAGVNAGAGISYINYELTKESQNAYKAEAMKMAARDAKVKAEAVAEGFDKRVGKLVSTSVNEFGYYPWNVYSARSGGMGEDVMMAKEASADLTPSEQEITASVSAVFKLR